MKSTLLLVAFLVSLISCRSRNAGQYFNRPQIKQCITLLEAGYMACNGVKKEIPSGMVIPESQLDFEIAEDYFIDRELGHYICLEFPNRCSRNP